MTFCLNLMAIVDTVWVETPGHLWPLKHFTFPVCLNKSHCCHSLSLSSLAIEYVGEDPQTVSCLLPQYYHLTFYTTATAQVHFRNVYCTLLLNCEIEYGKVSYTHWPSKMITFYILGVALFLSFSLYRPKEHFMCSTGHLSMTSALKTCCIFSLNMLWTFFHIV